MGNEKGFTLVEVLVATAIAIVVLAGIYRVYVSQQNSYIIQEQTAAMQQNLRAALLYMGREIRLAGCDPTGRVGVGAGITQMDPGHIRFTEDIRGTSPGDPPDGVLQPEEDIQYYIENDDLIREAANKQVLAENIESMELQYLNGSLVDTANRGDIRAIQVRLRARTDRRLREDFRRREFTTVVKCRNLGLGM
jgi:prepilin-type N-terminal cleavage/methylation domain-containing protein